MQYRNLFLLGLPLFASACVTSLERDKPFTQAWADHFYHQQEVQERVDRMKAGEIVLVGQSGGGRAAIQMDDRGKAKLNVGKLDGLSVDIRMGADKADFLVKYKWDWQIHPVRRNLLQPKATMFTRYVNKASERIETAERIGGE